MRGTRRDVIKAGLGGAALIGAPAIGPARAQPSRARTLQAVMHADLRVLDPIWTTANITSYHGGMIYDTLFALDEQLRPQPQMVERWGTSDDRKTWTFVLRDGLQFHDGSPVTSADVTASIRRWGARDSFGQHLMERVTDTAAADGRTVRIVLREPYPLMLDALAKVGTSCCYVMRRREAETDPNTQVRETIGSGPFTYNRDQSQPGTRHVYDRNPNYRPRSEPPSYNSGGKVVKLDRVMWLNMPDETTALAALRAGEIDFYEVPPQDLVPELRRDNALTVEILNKSGHMGWFRMNHLHPPFNNVAARRAMLHLVKQSDIMRAIFGDTEGAWRECGSAFGCGTSMTSDINTSWLTDGQNIARARELFREAGYDGRPVVILHATDHWYNNPCSLLTAQWLRAAGVNVELAASDWGAMLTRRAVRRPPAEGGWNIFTTTTTSHSLADVIGSSSTLFNGERGWFGWPTDPELHGMRDDWAAAPDLNARQAVARRMQQRHWDTVPQLFPGNMFRSSAWRRNITGVISMPELVPFWNMEKRTA
jgi:peptide/nickel transport system substrate-binding protein